MPALIPFATAFSAITTGALAGAGVTSLGILSAVSTVAFYGALAAPIALALGANAYIAHKLKPQTGAINDPGGLQQIVKQAIPPQRVAFGTVTTSGALFFLADDPPYLYYGLLLAAHKCGPLDSIYLNNHRVFIDANGEATSVPFRDGATSYLKVSYRDGDIDQAIDPILAADFPDLPSTFRQRGHTTAVIRAHYGFGVDRQAKDDDHKRVYGDSGQLTPLFRFKGAFCYDPRDPTHDINDSTTWSWSDNAAICFMRWLTFQWPDTRLLDPAKINWSLVAQAADICDEWEQSSLGDPFRRHTVNGIVQSTDQAFDVIEQMKLAGNSLLVLNGGKIYPVAFDRKRKPKATLHLDMVTGGFEFTNEARLREMANVVKTKFVAPDREWQTVLGPVDRRPALISADGAERERLVDGAFIEGHRRAQRAGSFVLNDSRLGKTLSVPVTEEAHEWVPGDVITVWFPKKFEKVNGTYQLRGKIANDKISGYQISLVEYDETAADFDPSDEQAFTIDEDVQAAA